MSVYDTARKLQMAGVVVHAHIDPNMMTPRINKSIETMLRTGIYKGWSSKAAQVARHLTFGLPCVYADSYSVNVRNHIHFESFDTPQIRELVEAERVIQLSHPHVANEHYIRTVNDYYKSTMAGLTDGNQHYFRIRVPELQQQFMQLLSARRTESYVKRAHALADRFASGETFPIVI